MSDIPPVSNGPVPENQTAAYKAAKMAVIILSVLIVMAVVALVVGGLTRLGGKTAAHGATGAFQLPPGARIVEMQSQPGRLILQGTRGPWRGDRYPRYPGRPPGRPGQDQFRQ